MSAPEPTITITGDTAEYITRTAAEAGMSVDSFLNSVTLLYRSMAGHEKAGRKIAVLDDKQAIVHEFSPPRGDAK